MGFITADQAIHPDTMQPEVREAAVNEDACDCGGTYDEYDRCSDCSNGHDDCSAQECFPCLERAIDRAESMEDR